MRRTPPALRFVLWRRALLCSVLIVPRRLQIKPEDVRIQVLRLNFANGDLNPLKLVRIYENKRSTTVTSATD
jgi:hypothetical protein